MSADGPMINVFLSSSMATPAHMALRAQLKKGLDETPSLRAFAIEAQASGDTSDEIMLQRIEFWADAVVMILQDDLRPGVEKEYYIAQREGKRLLVFVHTGSMTERLASFIERIRRVASPWQMSFDAQEELVGLVARSLVNDVVFSYKSSQRELLLLRRHVGRIIDPAAKQCYGFLKERYISDSTSAKPLDGCVEATFALMESITNASQPASEATSKVIAALPICFREAVAYRWEAIQSALQEDIASAHHALRSAQAEAAATRLPAWFRKDIVRDLQFMEILRANSGEGAAIESVGAFQDELKSLSGWDHRSPAYYDLYTLGHRFLSHTVKKYLTSERALVFGTGLSVHLEDLAEYMVSAIWLGSYSMIHVARSTLADVLLVYGFEHDDEDLLLEAMRLLIIAGDHTRLKELLKLHAHRIAPIAEQVFSEKGFSALYRESRDSQIARGLLLEYLGDLVPDSSLKETGDFIETAYQHDADRGFHGDVMRQSIRALERLPHA